MIRIVISVEIPEDTIPVFNEIVKDEPREIMDALITAFDPAHSDVCKNLITDAMFNRIDKESWETGKFVRFPLIRDGYRPSRILKAIQKADKDLFEHIYEYMISFVLEEATESILNGDTYRLFGSFGHIQIRTFDVVDESDLEVSQ